MFKAEPPKSINKGTYEFDIRISSQGDKNIYRDITLKVTIDTLELSIEKIFINGEEATPPELVIVKQGSNVAITAQINNTGTLPYNNTIFYDCLVELWVGNIIIDNKYLTNLKPKEIIKITFLWQVKYVPPEVNVTIILDAYENIPFSNRENLSKTVILKVIDTEKDEGIFESNLFLQLSIYPIIIIIILIFIPLYIKRKLKKPKSPNSTDDGFNGSENGLSVEVIPTKNLNMPLDRGKSNDTVNLDTENELIRKDERQNK